jgi:hypothetical protein
VTIFHYATTLKYISYKVKCKLHTPHSQVLPEKLTVTQLVKKFPTCYGTWSYITVFTAAHHWSVYWARCIQFTPSHSVSLRSILMLSSDLHSGLPSRLFPSGFPTKVLYRVFTFPMHATCPTHLILDLVILIILGKAYKLWISSSCSLLQLPTTSSLLGPNILFQHPVLRHPQSIFFPVNYIIFKIMWIQS